METEVTVVYTIMRGTGEGKGRIKDYYAGYGYDKCDLVSDCEELEKFGSEKEALEALKNYSCHARESQFTNGIGLIIEEFWVDESEYDVEDGEWYGGGDVVQFAELSEETAKAIRRENRKSSTNTRGRRYDSR